MQYRKIIAECLTYHLVVAAWRAKEAEFRRVMKYWEIIACVLLAT